ncbi:MAG: GPR endopeptidase, partial [Oscillospiraceae bacterium]|nr:GPR endopeptidase [Oscillospiraceae bacterium]
SIGVPTVVDAETLAADLIPEAKRGEFLDEVSPRGASMIVTPREIDLLVERAARLLALSINSALHPDIDPIDLLSAV